MNLKTKLYNCQPVDENPIIDAHFKDYLFECVEYLKDHVRISPQIVLNEELLTEVVNQIFKKVYREHNHIDEHFDEKLVAEQKVSELKAELRYRSEKNESLNRENSLLRTQIHNLQVKIKELENENN